MKRLKRRKAPSHGRRWSAAEDQLVRTFSAQQVADQLGVSHTLVHRRRRVLGVGLHEQQAVVGAQRNSATLQ